MGRLFIFLLSVGEDETIMGNLMKLFKTRSKAELKKILTLGVKNPFGVLKSLKKGELSQFLDILNSFKGNESKQFEIINNYEGQVGLSSSFLQYGIFFKKGNDGFSGDLILSMNDKEYDFGLTPTRIWLAMVQARGINGSGAGSVLWDTIWKNRRTLSESTGGVRGSKENLTKARQRIYLQIARNQKYLNSQLQRQGKTNYAIKQKVAKMQRKARTARKLGF